MPSADLVIDDASVSRRHVELFLRGDRLIVRDLGTKGATRLGDHPLGAKEEAPWPRGESLFVGPARLVFEDPVTEALEQLENAADERIADGELIDPPTGAPPSGAPASVPVTAVARSRSTPPAGRPSRSRAAPPPGWTMTDVVVALLAVIVLALSAAGLLWLLRSG
jgi:hypothetical protein